MAAKIRKAKQPAFYGSSNKVSTSQDDRSGSPFGTYYGTGVKAKVGRLRSGSNIGGNPVSKTKLKVPPRSVV